MKIGAVLTSVEIRGFKAIYNSGKIQLSPLTVFIGRNGSGKSSFLEALQWLQEAERSGVQEATVERFHDLDHLRNKRTGRMSLTLEMQEDSKLLVRYGLEVTAGAQGRPIVKDEWCSEGQAKGTRWDIWTDKGGRGPAVRNIQGANPVRDGDELALRSVVGTKAKGAQRLRGFLRGSVFLRLSPTRIAREGPLLKAPRAPLLDEEGAFLPALLAQLDEEQGEWVAQKLGEILPDVEAVGMVPTGENRGILIVDERMRGKGRSGHQVHRLPAWILSEGVRRLAAIFALLALRPRPRLIAIEEVENGLDPWTVQQVLEALKEASEEGTQILLTTHSPYLLDSVAPEQVLFTQRERGDTVFKPITSFPEVRKYEGQVAPGIMYISNYFAPKKGGHK